MVPRVLLASALILGVASTAAAQSARPASPVSPRAAELERRIEQAKAEVDAAQAALAALEQQLAAAEGAAMNVLIARACDGDEQAIRAVFAVAGTESDWVPYDSARMARAKDIRPFLRVLDEVWSATGPIAKNKFVWMLGVNGTAEAAERLRTMLAEETDPTILGNAIFALSRCPHSAENLAAVKRYIGDARLITHSFGFYPHGWYGADMEGGRNYTHQPLGLL